MRKERLLVSELEIKEAKWIPHTLDFPDLTEEQQASQRAPVDAILTLKMDRDPLGAGWAVDRQAVMCDPALHHFFSPSPATPAPVNTLPSQNLSPCTPLPPNYPTLPLIPQPPSSSTSHPMPLHTQVFLHLHYKLQ